MPYGRRPRSPAPSPSRGARLVRAPWLALVLALGGCATGGTGSGERDAERQATLDRWTRCIERQSDVASLRDVRTRVARGCEGHRRDVLHAFPPHMAPRLERLMDERTNAVMRARLRERGTPRDPLLRRAFEALSAS